MITDWAREGGISGFDIECDDCGLGEFIDKEYFRDFIIEVKLSGWKIFKDETGEWTHLCRDCAEKEKKACD